MDMMTMSKFKTIYIAEWSIIKPSEIRKRYGIKKLKNKDLDVIQDLEQQRKIKVRQLTNGIEIETYSYVGLIRLSDFQIIITPKIEKIQLARMLAYTYKIDDIDYLEDKSKIGAETALISDVMSLLFVKEVDKIMIKGLIKKYRQKEEEISSCRGKIMFSNLARNSSLGLTLPCRYQELTTDIAENKLILGTLKELVNWVITPSLKRKIKILIEKLSTQISYEPLSLNLLEKVKKNSNRLTSHYNTLIELAEIIFNKNDFSMSSGRIRFVSFLIDMNLLFEKFLYQYFNSLAKFHQIGIKYQRSLKNKYKCNEGQDHKLIPDYMFYKGEKLFAIADAKYKNYEVKSISSADLYQLTVYGLANNEKVNKIYLFYPSSEKGINKEYILTNSKYDKGIKVIVTGVPLRKILESISYSKINTEWFNCWVKEL